MATCYPSPPPKRHSNTAMTDPNSNPNPKAVYPNGPYRAPKSKPTPPPRHATFRLLCHASRIGGVIGKSGNIIKALQQATDAKIRVEDAPPESPDRVIFVVAPVFSSGGGNGGDGDGGDGSEEVSKAQEALVKVFERILDVAAEGDSSCLDDERVVSCRLLAEAAQVGSVIGKGGKVVEKIRRDTGCKIRVLNDRLPACAAPSDEIVEVEGSASSVKKALLAVSRRLQDSPSVDKTMKTMGSRPYEVVQHGASGVPYETSTDLRHRTSALPNLSGGSNFNSNGVHTWPPEVNRVPVLDPKATQQEVMFRILCSDDRVGAVIGKGGSIVRALQSDTGANINIFPPFPDCEDRLITITAMENPEMRYSPAQKAVVLVFSKSVEGIVEKGLDLGLKKEFSVTARLVVPSNQVGCLIGKGGAIVSEMRKATGTSIRIIGGKEVPKCVSDNDVVQISGEFSNVKDALHNVTSRLRDNLFVSMRNNAGLRNLSSVPAETNPYGRPRDHIPLGGPPVLGVSHSLGTHSLSQSIEHLSLNPNLDNASPGSWPQQRVAGINSRGTNDVRGLNSRKGGLEHGSGSKATAMTKTTVEIPVSDDVFGSVYGENGSNLDQLRQISGAKVTVQEPRHGTRGRTIVISGTLDETRAAQSLLQAFILNESSS
ncbi:hypothetical protein PIB30_084956 [Stylosanthes scabra]|uniref:K Homology domain-containing protein n=1 Tax=Stylosanthes scabra TaxID=79078 RepID=A0ABU6US97_9FABA|nr:hypothetical protein [Stylosanthes scabra]